MTRKSQLALAAAALLGVALIARAQTMHEHGMHAHGEASAPAVQDERTPVSFPPTLRTHTLANMRDHLLTLQRIQTALAEQRYEEAGTLAEERLGMSSLALHGAHDVAPFMPQQMQAIGTAMHRAASRFAVAAQDTAATGDVKPALAALAGVTEQCVACHAAFRFE